MKFPIAIIIATFGAVCAKEADNQKESLKERLLEHRADQFRDNDVRQPSTMVSHYPLQRTRVGVHLISCFVCGLFPFHLAVEIVFYQRPS